MKYLTIDDVCEMLSISRRTLERMREPSSKLGNDPLDNLREKLSRRLTLDESLIERQDLTSFRLQKDRLYFPSPDLYIGSSPRWEQDKLISWLAENGHRL